MNYTKSWCKIFYARMSRYSYYHIAKKENQKQPSRDVLCNFIEIVLLHECSPVNLLHLFRTPFFKNISGWLLLKVYWQQRENVLQAVNAWWNHHMPPLLADKFSWRLFERNSTILVLENLMGLDFPIFPIKQIYSLKQIPRRMVKSSLW